MKRLRIEHATGFAYHGDVSASYNEARMLPGTTDSQFVLSSSLDIEPSTSVNSYVDYFGTRVSAFDVLSPHSELKITARSLVEVRPRPVEHGGLTWDDLAAQTARGIDTVEQLVQTNRTRPHEEVVELAARIAAEHDDPGRAAHDICIAVGDAVGALREVGIPARYVSGYLHPRPDAEVGVPVTGESHAWVEWFAGDWQGFDPTNNIEIGDRHVLVGRGRDYNDVPPLRGVYAGPFKSQLHVKVTITREA